VVENSSLPLITHSYAQTGVYTVTLTLTDNDGLINTAIHPITIN
jgi:PKD repeat protein